MLYCVRRTGSKCSYKVIIVERSISLWGILSALTNQALSSAFHPTEYEAHLIAVLLYESISSLMCFKRKPVPFFLHVCPTLKKGVAKVSGKPSIVLDWLGLDHWHDLNFCEPSLTSGASLFQITEYCSCSAMWNPLQRTIRGTGWGRQRSYRDKCKRKGIFGASERWHFERVLCQL